MKGILLAGGTGSRLYPLTLSVSKQLLPIYDKPMVYYPLSTLMLAGIREILIISTNEDLPLYRKLLGDGSQFGLSISYSVQKKPNGIAEAFIIGQDFIKNDSVCLTLGDNIFYGDQFPQLLIDIKQNLNGATILGYRVKNPEDFGVIDLDVNEKPIGIVEKPKNPKSNFAVTGLYFYDNNVLNYAKNLKPSNRGELEISDINNIYLSKKKLNVKLLGRGFSWLDTGTHENLIEASQFIHIIEKRQGLKIACLEEIALINNWIEEEQITQLLKKIPDSEYKRYLKQIINKEN